MSASIAASLPTSITTHSSSSLKRKRDSQEKEPQRRDARNFVVSIGEGAQKRQRVLAPICLIHRARVPLAWLDPNGDGVRQVAGQIDQLEYQKEPTVLVAEEQSTKRYHAIETTGRKAYTMCRLASAVERTTIERRAITIYDVVRTSHSSAKSDAASSIRIAEETESTIGVADTQSISAFSTAAATSTATKIDSLANLPAPILPPNLSLALVDPVESQVDAVPSVDKDSILPVEDNIQAAEEVLKDLAKHYLSELYLSRTSLAYFVKGPLTRARLASENGVESASRMQQLISFLDELTLSTTTSDERLRKTIPEIINAKCTTEDASAEKPKKRKSNKTWKPKRDRHGMLPQEADHVEDWWQRVENDGQAEAIDSLDSTIKRRLLQLRKRETFLQIIIILETLSLTQAHPAQPDGGDKDQEKQGAEKAGSKSRGKKKMSSKELLDMLLDRLTIWFSVDSNSPQKGVINNQETKAEVNDELKNFCIEIIVPFYMVRLPKIAAAVSKKLGGPSGPTPVKRSSNSSKPGQSAQRKPLAEKRSRNSLQRTATDSNLLYRKPTPSLHRSATDGQVQDNMIFKRERSQSVSLHSVPTAHRRLGSSAFVREIDLTARTAANDEKLRKKAEQEAKVKAAIAGIRKPDRSLALKENAARVDAKFAETLAKAKKATLIQPGIQLDSQVVDIAATPRISRLFKATPQKHKPPTHVANGQFQASLPLADLDSGSTAIPQTGHRDRLQATVSATPCREVLTNPFELAALASLADSPAAQRGNIVAGTPMRPRTLFLLPETPLTKLVRHDERSRSSITSVKDVLIEASPNVVRQEKQAQKSVYDVLGWNDDNYEQLA